MSLHSNYAKTPQCKAPTTGPMDMAFEDPFLLPSLLQLIFEVFGRKNLYGALPWDRPGLLWKLFGSAYTQLSHSQSTADQLRTCFVHHVLTEESLLPKSPEIELHQTKWDYES